MKETVPSTRCICPKCLKNDDGDIPLPLPWLPKWLLPKPPLCPQLQLPRAMSSVSAEISSQYYIHPLCKLGVGILRWSILLWRHQASQLETSDESGRRDERLTRPATSSHPPGSPRRRRRVRYRVPPALEHV